MCETSIFQHFKTENTFITPYEKEVMLIQDQDFFFPISFKFTNFTGEE